MSLKKLLAITLLAMSTSLSALASDVVVPVDPVIEGQEVPAKGLYFSKAVLNLSSALRLRMFSSAGSHFIL